MTIAQDNLKEVAPGYVELFILDLTTIPGLSLTTPYYLCSVVNTTTKVIWNNEEFSPWPIELSGLSFSTNEAPARPQLNIGNLDENKLIGSLVFGYSDIVGAKVTYIRTYTSYLGGAGALSQPPIHFTIAKKIAHNRRIISFELRFPNDKERSFLPNRQMLKKDFPGLGLNKFIR